MPATEYQRRWYLENHDREKAKRRDHARNYRRRNPAARLLAGAKERARTRGLEFTIAADDIIIPTHCPILGVPLEVGTRYAPSLDRKESSQGYVPGNVWVISNKANVMKNDATPEELRSFALWALKQ